MTELAFPPSGEVLVIGGSIFAGIFGSAGISVVAPVVVDDDGAGELTTGLSC